VVSLQSTLAIQAPALPATVGCPIFKYKPGLSNPEPCTGPADRKIGSNLWRQAVSDAFLDAKLISEFGRSVPKYTAPEIRSLEQMDQQKVHEYNFQGSLCTKAPEELYIDTYRNRRKWVYDFATENFSENDVLYNSKQDMCPHPQLGPFDYSAGEMNEVDGGYFHVLSRSKFTLCPGGDGAWSMRFWEAIASHSLPLIHDLKQDNFVNAQSDEALSCLLSQYKYATTDQPNYDPEVVQQNYNTFIKYQTFMEGDNTPPSCSHLSKRR